MPPMIKGTNDESEDKVNRILHFRNILTQTVDYLLCQVPKSYYIDPKVLVPWIIVQHFLQAIINSSLSARARLKLSPRFVSGGGPVLREGSPKQLRSSLPVAPFRTSPHLVSVEIFLLAYGTCQISLLP